MKIISDDNFKNELKRISNEYGFEFEEVVYDKLTKYKELLVEWNEKINLTNITDNYEIIIKHFIDCMHIIKYIKYNDKVIDVGTGAGFPGMVIAICMNDKINITLLDSLNKRLIFLEEVKNKLNLKNVRIVHERAEEGAHKEEYREKFDIVVARAVASLNNLLEYTIGYIKVSGIGLYMKGNNYKEEIDISKKAFLTLGCSIKNIYDYELETDNEKYNRSIIEIEKKEILSNKYPRNYGQMKKKPL